MAIDLGEQALDSKKGGPFGAVIVREDKILGASGNRVYIENDPCAHAEIMAIRDACHNISSIELKGSVIYSSGEPCPMCMAAIYWSGISEVFFSNTEAQALNYGFWDKVILDELKKPKNKRKVKSVRIKNADAIKLFDKATKIH